MNMNFSKYLKAALVFCTITMLACDKDPSDNGSIFEKYFEENILNRDFIVNFASANGADITAQYNGYIFRMSKTDYYHGPAEAKIGSTVYPGTWSSNEDYSKLTITLPGSSPQL